MDESSVVERLSSSEFVNIVGHADADGVSASACICMALSVLDVPYRFTVVEEPSEASELSTDDGGVTNVFCDLGAQYLDAIPGDGVVIDHHPPRGEGAPVLGTGEASSSLPAYRVAREAGVRGPTAPVSALVGVIGDCGSLWAEEEAENVVRDALEVGAEESEGVLLPGSSPLETLAYATRPFTRLSGNYEATREFLENHGIEDDEFGPEFSTAVVLLALTNESARPSAVESLVGDEVVLNGVRLHGLSRYVEACAKTEKHGLAMSLCVEPRSDDEARKAWREFESDVIRRVREARIEDGDPTVARVEGDPSPVADVLYDWVTGDVVVLSADGKASIRSSSFDCGRVARKAAEATDGEGGGHPNRAGATFDAPAEVFAREVRRAL